MTATRFIQITIISVLFIATVGYIAAVVLSIGAQAGTCRIYGDGEHTVQTCDNGSYEVWGRNGRHRQYGDPNGGFEKYPGNEDRPMIEEDDDD